MTFRPIGTSTLSVAPLAFGGNVFGWTADKQVSFALLDAFVDSGFNLIDTADVYSRWVPGNQGGESETIIGEWLRQRGGRDKVVIATKLGAEMAPDKKGLSASYVRQAVEASLKRLQTDYIDLYQTHFDDLGTPVEETLGALADLVQTGKVRVIGASNMTPDRLEQSLIASQQKHYPAYQCLQPEYNLFDRENYETNYEPICRENGLGVIPYSSLASGFLSGKYRSEADASKSPRGGGITKKYLNSRGHQILNALDDVAERYSATPAQISLAWLMARPSITAPIVSASSVDQWHDLAKSAELSLDSNAIKALTDASAY
ncbi:aryl-alcohol dehydrogenase-like predicted oxidoreductase [Spirosoma oryzae]|uniref:Aryl-alcohol dehydrogenase-like predicted oxidoreductase n=1 Tax=Spirosoma oryzae TaxID=1469603 RepID=A0A2T0TB69_9BACT|nr:aldo/keto reductase [Spirosoma oryzae]PRY42894.1 aryl-alcohol dehydrogenase-like predicted oxidoreductase [Spirosoma oryzae]